MKKVERVMDKVTPLQILMGWKKHVKIVYRAVKAIDPKVEVYVTGGAVENRLTARSDVDVLLVLPHMPTFNEAVELRTRILEKAESLGLPLYTPIELHIIGKEELRKYIEKSKIVPADKL